MKTPQLQLYFIRHAQSKANIKPHIIGGSSNEVELTRKGRQQAKRLGQYLATKNYGFDEIYASIAERAKATAMLVCPYIGISVADIQYTDQIIELDQGEWAGGIRKKIYTPTILNQIEKDPWNFKAPQGESQKEVETRMCNWLQAKIIEPWLGEAKKIAIFTHGMAIKCLIRKLLEASPSMTYKIQIENTSITQFNYHKTQGWHFIQSNNFAHLSRTSFQEND